MMEKLRIGVLGAGMIATHPGGILANLESVADRIEIVSIASRTRRRAEEVAARFGIAEVRDSLSEMLIRDDLDVVVNLTPVAAHSETNLEIVSAGKHLVTEKPLAATMSDADEIIRIAHDRGLLVVAAPPWLLDPRRVAARDVIRSGAIGHVAFARSRSSHAGPAAMSWPADPSWFYAEGGGALLDMGVYGITEVTGMLGPAQRVTALSGITRATRVVEGGPHNGQTIEVTADDNTLLLLDFGDATFAVVDATFNVVAASSPSLEVFGAQGTLNLYDPFWANRGQPAIEVFHADQAAWAALDLSALHDAQERFDRLGRGILVTHFVECFDSGARPVLGAEHARHTLEIMLGAQLSAKSGRAVRLDSTFSFAGSALDA
jgi:predicted dehydrogenase